MPIQYRPARADAALSIAVAHGMRITLPMLFLTIGAATLLVALAIWKTMPKAS